MRMIKISAVTFLCAVSLFIGALLESRSAKNPVTRKVVSNAERLLGLEFSDKDRDLMLEGLNDKQGSYEQIRKVPLSNSVLPAILLNPIPPGMTLESVQKPIQFSDPGAVSLPANRDELSFYPISKLALLIRTKQISSVDLTRMYMDRLKEYGPKLECTVTLTEDLAMQQAKRADEELASGKYRGLLHGIPYGAKDLLATKGIRTTWGTAPYKDQVIDEDATVIARLEKAGAVLVAKLTLGELAWGDVWYGGTTKNPWNYKQGSSGSSAGPASATAAGLVPFAIGSETWGSIVSPSSRCGITGLRPSYGRVSRKGAMALSWSMDKLGPICRNVEDCAIVFDAIRGPDGEDPTVYDVPFNYNPSAKLNDLKIGYLKSDFERPDDPENPEDPTDETAANDQATLAKLRELGAMLVPVDLPKLPVEATSIILDVEAAAAFDQLTRSGKLALMKRQEKNAWPNTFRQARLIPGVEYIQANRIRTLLIQEMARIMKDLDVYVSPSFKGDNLLLTNLTGHPCVVVPNGFKKDGTPTSISFTGKLFGEAEALSVAAIYQNATDFHLKRPQLKE